MTIALGVQHWRDLLFLHWEVPATALRALVPRQLDVDTYADRAYVGLVPFRIWGNRARGLPALPGLSDFYEVNLRTYVRYQGRDPGVWFFSLDASNMAAVIGARAGWQLPYYHSRAGETRRDGIIHYTSERLRPGPVPARLEVRYRTGEPLGTAVPGTLEHFFVERYVLYTLWRPIALMASDVRHQPYPLQRATLEHLTCDTLVSAHGLPGPTGAVHAVFSPGVDVDILSLRRPGR
jgi:uncharacterized protein